MADRSAHRRAWVAAGLGELTGRGDGPPLLPPDDLVGRVVDLGRPLAVDVLPLLAERVAGRGMVRRGDVSAGGATRLLPAADGWIAVTLSRPDDLDLLPAWIGVADAADVAPAVAVEPVADVVERGALLGLPVARVGEVAAPGEGPVRATQLHAGTRRSERPRSVVNLASLWAGPLCARLLAAGGAAVVKVESPRRPEPPADPLGAHEAVEVVRIDLDQPADRERLVELVAAADVVIEGSRPRVLEHAGIDVPSLVSQQDLVWVAITGYGRTGPGRNRVAFGDDAAAAGGLVAWDERGPCFVADAVADPLSGVVAAAAAVAAFDAGGGWLLDVAMSRVAAHVADGTGSWDPAP